MFLNYIQFIIHKNNIYITLSVIIIQISLQTCKLRNLFYIISKRILIYETLIWRQGQFLSQRLEQMMEQHELIQNAVSHN